MPRPFTLQSPEHIATEYGGNKQKIAQAAQMGMVDPTAAVMAGMFIDRMRAAQMAEQTPQQTVAQQVLAPQPQAPPPQGGPPPPGGGQPSDGGPPPGGPPPAGMVPGGGVPPGPPPGGPPPGGPPPQGMAAGGLLAIGGSVPDSMFNYSGGGIVAFDDGGQVHAPGAYYSPGIGGTPWGKALGLDKTMTPAEQAAYAAQQRAEGVAAKIQGNETLRQVGNIIPKNLGIGQAREPLTPEMAAAEAAKQWDAQGKPFVAANAKVAPTPQTTAQKTAAAPGATQTATQAAAAAAPAAPAGTAPAAPKAPAGPRGGLGSLSVSASSSGRTKGILAPAVGPDSPETHVRAYADGMAKLLAQTKAPEHLSTAISPDELDKYKESYAKLTGIDTTETDKAMEEARKAPEKIKAQKKQDMWQSLAEIGFAWAGSTSQNPLQALGAAASGAMPAMAERTKERRQDEKDARKELVTLEGQKNAQKIAQATGALTLWNTFQENTKFNLNADQQQEQFKLKTGIEVGSLYAEADKMVNERAIAAGNNAATVASARIAASAKGEHVSDPQMEIGAIYQADPRSLSKDVNQQKAAMADAVIKWKSTGPQQAGTDWSNGMFGPVGAGPGGPSWKPPAGSSATRIN